MTTLGRYLSQRRIELRLSQQEVSERLRERGVDRSAPTIAHWERDRQQVPIDFFPILAEVLETSVTKLYEHAGLLDNLPGREFVKLLDGLPDDEVAKIYRMISAYLQNAG